MNRHSFWGMPAATRTSFQRFSSETTNEPNISAEPALTSTPAFVMRSLTALSASASMIVLFSLAITGFGVPFAASIPYHVVTS